MQSRISYDLATNAWLNHTKFLQTLIVENGVKQVCDVGGGANPALSCPFIKEHQLEYTLADIDAQELSKAPDQYHKVEIDFTKRAISGGTYDLIFSKMVMEHVKDVESFMLIFLGAYDRAAWPFIFFRALLPFLF